MRVRLSRVALALAVLGAIGIGAGAGIIASGWYNVAALDPHPRPISWVLHKAMRESVQFYSHGITAPDLSDPGLANRAAGHYAARCQPCHGAPGVARDIGGRAIYPRATDLSKAVPDWEPEELFWIVNHGIKLSGMPAWGPTHREDEIWAITAFLRRLPEMSPEEYRLATNAALDREPDMPIAADAGAELVRSGVPFEGITACARCHGLDGAGLPGGGIPRLSGQDAGYLAEALESYAIGLRKSGIMGPIAQALTPEQRRAAAAYFAEIDEAPAPPPPEVEPEVLRAGAELARSGAPERGVPACASCHGGFGSPPVPGIPAIAGQFADYMELQFALWRSGLRGAGPDGGIMQRLSLILSDAEIEAVTRFYASLRDETDHLALD